ncbi:MAG TPA: AraC family transcriptional regulator [Puia sp.]|nr:AraC family transcriptional regulator [Puia sp.]
MKHRKRPYTSVTHVWNNASAVFYSADLTPLHSHNTIQLILDTQKNFKFRPINGSWNTYKTLIIKENVIHQLDTNDSVQLMIYLDAGSELARMIKERFLKENDFHAPDMNIFHLVNSMELEKALLQPGPFLFQNLIYRILERLTLQHVHAPVDKRISQIEQIISTSEPNEFTIKSLAETVFLSESRLRSLFKCETEVSLYHYILWNKLRYAINQIMSGDTVAGAAIEGGFNDSSHFHKMMVKMFGISPSGFLKANKTDDHIIRDKAPMYFKTKVYGSG